MPDAPFPTAHCVAKRGDEAISYPSSTAGPAGWRRHTRRLTPIKKPFPERCSVIRSVLDQVFGVTMKAMALDSVLRGLTSAAILVAMSSVSVNVLAQNAGPTDPLGLASIPSLLRSLQGLRVDHVDWHSILP